MTEFYNIICKDTLFIYSFIKISQRANDFGQFVICKEQNDINRILEHLENVSDQIGFGNNQVDYNYLHFIIENRDILITITPEDILLRLSRLKRQIQEAGGIYSPKKYINQFDLMSFFGLKPQSYNITDLKYSIYMYDIRECDKNYMLTNNDYLALKRTGIINVYSIEKLYNIAIGKKSLFERIENANLISARYDLCKELNIYNFDTSPSWFAMAYIAALIKEDVNSLRDQARRNSDSFNIKECLPKYLSVKFFNNDRLNDFVTEISNLSYSEYRDKTFVINAFDSNIKIGNGGIHGCCGSGKFIASDDTEIFDLDIKSMYAVMAISEKIYPRHIGDKFVDAMSNIVNRKFATEGKDDSVNNGINIILKRTLNYIYGKTKEPESPVYDPMYSVSVVLAAQMFMLKLLERLYNNVEGFTALMINTDGITFRCKKGSFNKILLSLREIKNIEHGVRVKVKKYNKLFIRDINNYVGLTESNDIVKRGLFDYSLWFNRSTCKIIPYAAVRYLLFDEPVEKTVTDPRNEISDFSFKAKGDILFCKYIGDTDCFNDIIQSISRYYYSTDFKSSCVIYSQKKDGKTNDRITDNFPVTILNSIGGSGPEINYSYYINEALNLAYSVNTNSIELF